MSPERPGLGPPSFRKTHPTSPFPEERAWIVCQCGVLMEFDWPRGQADIRCFGCGSSFSRPDHFPAHELAPWHPPARTRLGRVLKAGGPPVWLALILSLLAAVLLGIGLGIVLG